MITITNNGQALTGTNYWETDHAAVGMLYLSGNAGALRLLVPEAAEGLLAEMRTGKRVTIEASVHLPGGQCVDLVFEDGTAAPFSVALDRRQIDRPLQCAADIPFTVWTEGGGMVLALTADVRA